MNTSELLHLFNQKLRLFTKELNEILQEFDLYASQWTILYTLHERGKMTQTEIWQYLKVEAPTTTRTLVRMEKNGWIRRKAGSDKRERMVELTEKATQQIPLILDTVKKCEDRFLHKLSSTEQIKLHEFLSKLDLERDE